MMQFATLCIGIITVTTTAAFTPSIPNSGRSTVLRDQLSGDNDSNSAEVFLEQVSQRGAEKVAKMDIAERTKRAMLAEAVENSILSKEIQLEEIIGDSGIIPTDPELLEQCRDISRQIKASQQQYEALVSGGKSELLNTLDSLGKDED
jgi:hypothetical protein